MKRFLLCILSIGFFINCFATDYYSQGSVTPNTLTNWNTLPGGGGANPGSFTIAGDKFIIQNGHTMTTTATWSVGGTGSTLQIQSGGVLQGDNTIQLTGTFQIDNGGTYIHNNVGTVAQTPAGTSIFSGTESFGVSSSFEIRKWIDNITGLPNSAPGIAWGNLIINLQSDLGTWNWNFADGQTLTVNGNLDIRATYASTAAELRLTPTGTHTINVGGNFLLSGSKTQVAMKKRNTTPLDNYTTMQVNGDVSLTGSAQLDLGINTTSTTAIGLYELRFKGNFSASAGTTITSTSVTPYLVANGSSVQTISCSPTMDCNFRIASGSTANLSSTITTGTNRTVAVLGTLAQNGNSLTVNGKLETAGGIFNSNAAFTVGINCTSCSSDGTYNSGSSTWCTLTGTKGTINFVGNLVTLNNNISNTYVSAGHFTISSPGDVYFVNATTTAPSAVLPSGYFVKPNSILSLDANSYLAGTNSTYLGQGGTLRIGSTDGIRALPNTSNGNIRTTSIRTYNSSGTNNFEYFGTSPQVTGDGLPTTITGTLKINNIAGISSLGVTLSQNTTVDGILDLTWGKLRTSASSLMSISATGSIVNDGDSSFVGGPLKQTGHNSFWYPIGINAATAPTGTIYAPLNMVYFSGVTNSTDSYTAEYLRDNPYTSVDPDVGDSIDHVSYVEYWKHQRNDGGSNTPLKKIVLRVNFLSFCYNLDSLMVARFDTLQSKWLSEGNSQIPTAPDGTSGLFFSGYTHSEYIPRISGVFTLSTNLPFAGNPLPIKLISFDAFKLSNTRSTINWELAACCSAAAKFEVQRAGKDKGFITIATIGGSTTNRFYDFLDNDLKNGVNYYRLKMIDEDGKITYSRIVAVMNGVNGLLLTSLIPSVVNDNTTLTIASSSAQKLDIMIVDMQGRLVYKQNYSVGTGNTSIEISTNHLHAGVYQLVGVTAEGKTNLIRFIKQ